MRIFTLLCLFVISSTPLAFAESRPTNTWVPTSGYTYAIDGSAYPNTVFMYTDWEWSSSSRLSGLKEDGNETLEVQIVFYDYDDNAYADGWYNYDQYNKYRGQYWETNQPRPYWDTLVLDNNEKSFAVGCSDANQFQADKMYYWWGYGEKNSSGSWTKVSAQRGYRLPSTCYERSWCVEGEQTAIIVDFTEHWSTPGSKSWTY